MRVRILLALAVVVLALAAYVATRPSEFRVARAVTIAAPARDVFGHVNALRTWQAWSPWAKKDPQMRQSYEGPAAGVGAVTSWIGNQDVGEGRMTIVESRTNELIGIRLEFFQPFTATHSAEFTFSPESDGTLVTWTMSGHHDLVGKAMGLVLDFDKLIGADFEQGLAALKRRVESAPQ